MNRDKIVFDGTTKLRAEVLQRQLAPLAVGVVAEPAAARNVEVDRPYQLVQLQAPGVQRGANAELGKWVSRIHVPGKNQGEIWLGSFSTANMAAYAHDAAALAINGNSDILNFPKLAPFLPRAVSSSRHDVKAAAAKAASMTSFSVSADAATPSPLDTLSPPISAPRTLSSCSSSLLPSSCIDNAGEILGKLVELPRLGAICECEPMMSDVINNLVYSDLDTWADPSGDRMNSTKSGIGSSF